MGSQNSKTKDSLLRRQKQTREVTKGDKDPNKEAHLETYIGTDTSLQIEDATMTMDRVWSRFGCMFKFSLFMLALICVFCCEFLTAKSSSSSSSSSAFLDDDTISKLLIEEIKAVNIDHHLKSLTSLPHLSGTPNDQKTVEYISNFWHQINLDTVNIVPYEVLLSSPNERNPNYISVVDKSGEVIFKTFSKEVPFESDPLKDAQQAFNAYSASATVQGPLVYINYGRLSDFKYVTDQMKIGLDGKICLIRYGFGFRANKVKLAEKHGCIGVVLFSDPDDFVKNMTHKTYPNSWWLPGSGVQRGTIKDSSRGTGDPSTPYYPSTSEAYRYSRKEMILPEIPCQPIGYDDALVLLSAMTGEQVPLRWRGLLNVTYRFGPTLKSNIGHVELSVNNDWGLGTIKNIIGYVRGQVEPDRYVMIGNHHDAWVYGGTDPNSGTAVMLEVSRAVMEIVKSGVWRPRRTIVFCSWGGEEQGIIGSREFVQQYGKILAERAVAYLNVDSAVQGRHVFYGKALPILNSVMYEATKKVRNPDAEEFKAGRRSVYDTWLRRKPDVASDLPKVTKLGSGSDFAPFYASVGVPCTDIRFYYDIRLNISSYPLYHTAYDNYRMFSTFHDPGFVYARALGQIWVEMVRSLSSPPILPLHTTQYSLTLSRNYAKFVERFADTLAKYDVQVGNLTQAVKHFAACTHTFDQKIKSIDPNNALQVRQYNDQTMQLERSFIDYMGLPGRPLIRHVLFAPLSSNSYASSIFPGLSGALSDLENGVKEEDGMKEEGGMTAATSERLEMVKKQVSIVTFFIKTASVNLNDPVSFAQ